MRIILVSPRYYPHIGGVEYVVKSIAERLAKMNYEVTILTGEPHTSIPAEEEINGVHVIRWPTWAPGNAYHIPRQKNKLDKLIDRLARETDVVHVHSAHAILPVYVGIRMREINSIMKLVFSPHYHAHGHTLIRELAWRVLWRKYVRKLIKYADKIHAVSNVEAKRIIEHYPEAGGKLVIIPNGVEEDVLQYKWKGQNSNYIMYAGRIEKYKRLEVAVDLITELDKRGYNLRLLIVGQGPHLLRLKQYTQNKASHKVRFKPPLPRKEYLKLVANAYATINPSYFEAFSVFIAESLAIGTPAIVSQAIAKIYCYQNAQDISPLPAELSSIADKLGLQILTGFRQKIKTWDGIVKEILYEVYR